MNDVTFTGAGLVIITALLTALSTVVTFLFRALMNAQAERYAAVMASKDAALLSVVASKDSQIEEMKTDRDNYRRMALQATIIIEKRVNKDREQRGDSPFDRIPSVVPEHNSPTTEKQKDEAEFATLRARVAAAARELGEPVPELNPGHGTPADSDVDAARGHAHEDAIQAGAEALASATKVETITIHHAELSGVVSTAADGTSTISDATLKGIAITSPADHPPAASDPPNVRPTVPEQ